MCPRQLLFRPEHSPYYLLIQNAQQILDQKILSNNLFDFFIGLITTHVNPSTFRLFPSPSLPHIGQPVLLRTAVGFVGDGIFDKFPVQQLFDHALKSSRFAFQLQSFSQFIC